ncbi:MAG: M67 family metallopeptidase [Anaerolineae bacterium]|jgi:proteasome lid subunit RPN8/RPN11|nr:M67 family metallopeptidase [Anaerolineae bacterium]
MVTEIALPLPQMMVDQIITHAEAGYPEEVCGLVAGRGNEPVALYHARNVSPTPRIAYEVDVETLARMIEWEDEGLELLAIYHSHPHGPPAPSETDIAQATYPDAVYVIVSLADRSHPQLRAFRLTP